MVNSQQPKIGRWRFVVLLAAFITRILVRTPNGSFSVMYAHHLISSSVSSTLVTWIYNLYNCFFDIGLFFVGPLCEVFGWRKVITIAAFLLSFSTFCSGFLETPLGLFFTYSVISGINAGIINKWCVLVISRYFTGQRGAAVGFLYFSSPLGDFVSPQLIYYLQQSYGERSSLFLTGAIMLNICATALTFHPLQWHIVKTMKESSPHDVGVPHGAPHEELASDGCFDEPIQEFPKDSNEVHRDLKETRNKSSPRLSTSFQIISEVLSSLKQNIKMFKHFRVIIIAFSSSLFLTTSMNALMLIPFVLDSRGTQMNQIVFYVSIMGISHAGAVLCTSPLTDFSKGFIKYIYMLGLLTFSMALIGFGLVSDERWTYFFMILIGICMGTCSPLVVLVIIDIMGVESLPSVFGATGVTNAISFLTVGPLFGLLRDYTGDYELTIQVFALPLLLSFMAWCFMTMAVKRDKRLLQESK